MVRPGRRAGDLFSHKPCHAKTASPQPPHVSVTRCRWCT
ncbi:MAG: hypothetical protein AVDCRST_MAG68-4640 [uncultured Gemmatimonadetes bacterium]|uniref:Uncharacterized protein n=1 Tax=uncultured Gemmatimonadota bacterium TaxID=203437 RepID=A0A6J4MSG6_9BACT|nr:MAG: hypothetical protein AVDCRST_MAG68-4640 [uncultured Gemmatimonadota bacterium]